MAIRAKTELKIVDADHQQAETAIVDAAKQAAPIVRRFATHRDRIDLAVKELESERFELISRRDLLRRQFEAVEQGYAMHIDDIEATIKLYESGLNTVAVPHETSSTEAPDDLVDMLFAHPTRSVSKSTATPAGAIGLTANMSSNRV